MTWFFGLCQTALMLALTFIFIVIIGILLIRLCGGTVHVAIFPEDEFKEMMDELKNEMNEEED